MTTAREAQTSDTDVERELAGALRATFAGLDTKYRLPLALCYQENMTQRDAAAVLELPERTVSEHINVGLAKLRKALERAGYPAAVAAVLGGLKQTAPAVPASLAGRVEALVAKGVAVQAAAVKGGLAVKWIAGIVLAGAVVAGVAAVSTERRPQASPASAVIYDDQFENAKLASFWQHREPTDCAGTGDGLALRIPRGVGTGSAEMRSRPVKLGAGSLEVLVEHSDYGGNSSWRRNGVELLDETGRTVCALERVVRGRGGYWFAAGEGPRKEIPLSSGVGRSFALRLDRTGRASLLSGNRELAKGRASGGVRAVTIRIYEEMRWGTYMTWRIDRVTVRRLRGGTQ